MAERGEKEEEGATHDASMTLGASKDARAATSAATASTTSSKDTRGATSSETSLGEVAGSASKSAPASASVGARASRSSSRSASVSASDSGSSSGTPASEEVRDGEARDGNGREKRARKPVGPAPPPLRTDSLRVPFNTSEASRDLQDRIARFARMAVIISGSMYFISIAMMMTVDRMSIVDAITAGHRLVHLGGIALAFTVWRTCKRGEALGPDTLAAIDGVFAIGFSTCWSFMIVTGVEGAELSVTLAMTYTLIARSVLVPSSFRRSLVISAFAALPNVIMFTRRELENMDATGAAFRTRTFVFTASWSLIAVIVAALNSRMIFGLREKIREIGRLGQYTLEERLGEGGMGVVYRATHAMLRRPAAIKLLLPDRAGQKDLARFEREVQMTSRLRHPNTISIFDYGRTSDDVFYYVMEFLEGLDLEQLVHAIGPVDPPRAIHILAQVSGALSEAHSLKLIHRDIKPANIMLTQRVDEPDVVKVVDFGLVKTLSRDSDAISLSAANVITGTPMYLAPEAILAPDSVDGRSDIYALGAVAYFLLTAEHVFLGDTVLEICGKHIHETPMRPSERLGKPIPADLEALILSALAKKAEDRPQTAAAFRESLLACESADHYDAKAATEWWRTKARAIREGKRPRSIGSSTTMQIDFSKREDIGSAWPPRANDV